MGCTDLVRSTRCSGDEITLLAELSNGLLRASDRRYGFIHLAKVGIELLIDFARQGPSRPGSLAFDLKSTKCLE